MTTYERDDERRRRSYGRGPYPRGEHTAYGYGPAVRRKGTSMDWLWWVIGLAALVIAALVLIPLFADDDDDVGFNNRFGAAPAAVAPGAPARLGGFEGVGAEIGDILDDPAAWMGRPVIVSGEVDDVLGPRTFVLEDGGLFFDNEILVVSAIELVAPAGGVLAEDTELRVAGVVTMLNTVADLEREVGFALDDRLFQGFIGQPVLVARDVARAGAGR